MREIASKNCCSDIIFL